MKKKLLVIFLPVIIAIAGSLAVWANEPGATQPACDKCAKSGASAAAAEKGAQDIKAAPGCDKCPKMKAAAAGKPCGDGGCDMHAKTGKAGAGCDNCQKMKGAEGKPCGAEGCAKQAKDAAGGCDKCPKMKGAEGKPCGEKGCDKSAKLQQTDKKPCCDKDKKE